MNFLIYLYSAPDTIGGWSETELNIMHFYTKHNFLLALWEDLPALDPKQRRSFEKRTFW